jgi:hypothetical protein
VREVQAWNGAAAPHCQVPRAQQSGALSNTPKIMTLWAEGESMLSYRWRKALRHNQNFNFRIGLPFDRRQRLIAKQISTIF